MGETDRKNSRMLIALLLAVLLVFAPMGTVLAEGAADIATATSVETATPTDTATPTQKEEPQTQQGTPTELPDTEPSQESMETLFPELEGLVPGVDYVADEVVYVGDSYREALSVTEELAPLDAELDSVNQGVAVIKVDFDAYNEAADEAAEAAESDTTKAAEEVAPIEEIKDVVPEIAPNYIYSIADTTDDSQTLPLAAATNAAALPYYANTYWYNGTNGMHAEQAKNAAGTLDTIDVAVLDTGVDVTHPAISQRCVQSQYNYNGTTGGFDGNGHGTHVAGIVAAVSDNARIVSIKILGDDGKGTSSMMAAGVRLAITLHDTTNPNLKVMNMSLASGVPGYDSLMATVIAEAYVEGILSVCAAGNETSSSKYSPACEQYALSVGATDTSGSKASYSNYGDWVDMVAPGTGIYSTVPGGRYGTMNGTSMAAPMVAGEAAILYGIDAALKNNHTGASVDGAVNMLRTYSRGAAPAGFPNAKIADAYELVKAYSRPSIGVRLANADSDYSDYTKVPSGDNFVSLYATKEVDIRYTVNGAMPSAYDEGTEYTGRFTLTSADKQMQTVRAASFSKTTHDLLATATSTFTVLPESGNPLSATSTHLAQPEYTAVPMRITGADAGASWYSARPTTVIVDDSGNILLRNAISQKYTAAVYAFGSGSYQKIDITAYPTSVTGVTIDQSDIIVSSDASDALGNRRQLTATVSGTGTAGSNYCNTIRWSSGSPGIAVVDENGVVTGRAAGTAIIKAETVDGSERYAELSVRVIASSGISGGCAVIVDIPSGYSGREVWVDGVIATATNLASRTSVPGDSNTLVVPISGTGKTNVTMYQYRADGVPIGMYVWTLDYSDTTRSYCAKGQPAMQDLLSYAGFSIRVTGNAGIRVKTGIVPSTRATLLSAAGIDGWRLVEYGTIAMYGSKYDEGYKCVKGGDNTATGKAYYTDANGKVKDMVFETKGGRYRYTSVLTNIDPQNYNANYNFRGFITLTKDGSDVTLYGPMVSRSIYYIAKQIMDAGEFSTGTSAYNFVKNIIDTVDPPQPATDTNAGN